MSEQIELYRKFEVLKNLNNISFSQVKALYIFKHKSVISRKSNVFIIMNDDKAFAFGPNNYGVLGFGTEIEVNELTINENLSYKQIIDFKNGCEHVVARTIDGKVYCWGRNVFGVLGNGREDKNVYEPEINKHLSDKHIVDICCGQWHSLALTDFGEVYTWGLNINVQFGNISGKDRFVIPRKVIGFDGKKVIMISCGYKHSMALTECGHVFSWGYNKSGQLGHISNKPSFVKLGTDVLIKNISCGYEHSLMLSRDGDIYVFGDNTNGQLGIKTRYEIQLLPLKLSYNSEKFEDIASHYYNEISSGHDISIAKTTDGIYYIWGECNGEIIKEPKHTEFKSFYEILAHFGQITYQTIHRLNETILSTKDKKFEMNFDEINFVSSGSFSVVYKATHKNSKQTYAIKKIPFSEDQIDQICNESKMISNLNHKYVVQCYDVWIEENYLINENNIITNEAISSGANFLDRRNNLLLHIQMEFCLKTLKDIIVLEIKKQSMTLGYYQGCPDYFTPGGG